MLFKKLCLITANRSDYGKVRYLVREIKKSSIDLTIIALGSMPYDKFGVPIDDIKEDGYSPVVLRSNFLGDHNLDILKTMSMQLYDVSSKLDEIRPDAIIVTGDRYDMLPAAIAASVMNIPIIHIQGGERSGCIDDVIRDAISKLSHIHFVSNEICKNRLVGIGEKSEHIHSVGCPGLDFLLSRNVGDDINMNSLKKFCKDDISLSRNDKYFIVMVHPNTSDHHDIDVDVVLKAISHFNNKKVVFYPNNDADCEVIVQKITRTKDVIKFKHVAMEEFIMLMAHASCIIGNSSAGIRESASLGIPCINIGNRQQGRDRNSNTIDVCCKEEDIVDAITRGLSSSYSRDNIYGDGKASGRIIDILNSYNTISYKNIHI